MKNKFTSLLALICAFSLCIGGGVVNSFAASIELTDAIYSSTPEALIAPQLDLNTNAPALENGEYRYYYTSSGNHFTIKKDTKVFVTVNTNVNSNVIIGYHPVGGSNVTKYTSPIKTKTHSTSFTIPADGEYTIWIYNNGSDSFKVTGGSITF